MYDPAQKHLSCRLYMLLYSSPSPLNAFSASGKPKLLAGRGGWIRKSLRRATGFQSMAPQRSRYLLPSAVAGLGRRAFHQRCQAGSAIGRLFPNVHERFQQTFSVLGPNPMYENTLDRNAKPNGAPSMRLVRMSLTRKVHLALAFQLSLWPSQSQPLKHQLPTTWKLC